MDSQGERFLETNGIAVRFQLKATDGDRFLF